MSYTKKIPAADRVLAAMTPGEVQSPSDLAKRFGTAASLVRPVLEQLVTDGALTRVPCLRVKRPNYILAGTEKHTATRDGYVGIPAGRRTYAVLSGNLNGYDAEIRRRADLCMMVRR
ncbi:MULTISPECIES: hypothetical protein [unclassified Burkholderia]|uniref:hypothetical protein n=1 Tax=unclassified Burkholderia TaxID=2613784 RepID=UPI000F58F16F|nr:MULTISPECIES: hypothetical protein [unclassified Burkholderia]RQR87661.1 hypothetical protein DIE10_06105 [Burkholderia sp. Bp9011]RQR97009.1 hypothetical protein DIE09_06295 [Burkholderia sp. Bp9010]RQS80715.1 hypothetical protein DID97_05775 [Burkholderia sp. Bp8977]